MKKSWRSRKAIKILNWKRRHFSLFSFLINPFHVLIFTTTFYIISDNRLVLVVAIVLAKEILIFLQSRSFNPTFVFEYREGEISRRVINYETIDTSTERVYLSDLYYFVVCARVRVTRTVKRSIINSTKLAGHWKMSRMMLDNSSRYVLSVIFIESFVKIEICPWRDENHRGRERGTGKDFWSRCKRKLFCKNLLEFLCKRNIWKSIWF